MLASAKIIYKKKNYRIVDFHDPLNDYINTIQVPYEIRFPTNPGGYSSKWFIDNNKLFLTEWSGSIFVYTEKPIKQGEYFFGGKGFYKDVNMDYLFPDQSVVFANWFSGVVAIGVGAIVGEASSGEIVYDIFRGIKYLTFKNGMLISETKKTLSLKGVRNKVWIEEKIF